MNRRWFKDLKIVICLLVMLYMCLVCILAEKPGGRHSLSAMHVIGWVGIVFFGVCAIIWIYKVITGTLRGGIAEEGLYVKGECIPWQQITKISIWRHDGGTMGLYIATTDCEEKIASAPWWKRWMLQYDYKHYGAIYYLTDNMFDGSCEAFIDSCQPYLNKNKSKNTNLTNM